MGKNNSFLPEDYLDKKIARRTNVTCVGLFVVMIAAIAAAFYVQSRQDQGTRAELVEINETFNKRAGQLRQIEELQNQQKQMIEKAKVVRQLVERVPRSIILAEMINDMPKSLSLLEFRLETKSAPKARNLTALDRAKAKKKSKNDKEAGKVEIIRRDVLIEIEGVAQNENQITEFMGKLSHHPLFDQVQLSFITKDTIEKTDLFRFGIGMTLNQAVLIERSAPEQLERALDQDPLADNIKITPDGKPGDDEGSVAGVDTPTE